MTTRKRRSRQAFSNSAWAPRRINSPLTILIGVKNDSIHAEFTSLHLTFSRVW
ncbi:MAG: hypothetical protein AB1451_11220 [Nitrospirota bacterium]